MGITQRRSALQFDEKWGLANTVENCSTDNFYKILLLYSRNSAIILFKKTLRYFYIRLLRKIHFWEE